MNIIKHRINTISDLKNTPHNFGIELDIRSNNGKLILGHDPFIDGTFFEEFLVHYKHNAMIVNIKEEGLESEIITTLEKYKISNYFFLDQSFPFLVKYLKTGFTRTAIRISEYESFASYQNLVKNNLVPDWMWIDYFSTFPLSINELNIIGTFPTSTCLVSPELQGYSIEDARNYAHFVHSLPHKFDAVCTKLPSIWFG